MPALNFLPLPRVSHPKPPGQTDGLPTLPGPCGTTHLNDGSGLVAIAGSISFITPVTWAGEAVEDRLGSQLPRS